MGEPASIRRAISVSEPVGGRPWGCPGLGRVTASLGPRRTSRSRSGPRGARGCEGGVRRAGGALVRIRRASAPRCESAASRSGARPARRCGGAARRAGLGFALRSGLSPAVPIAGATTMPTATNTIVQTLCQLGIVFIDSLLFFKPASKTSLATCDSGLTLTRSVSHPRPHPPRVDGESDGWLATQSMS
jgi:hypothetical protein